MADEVLQRLQELQGELEPLAVSLATRTKAEQAELTALEEQHTAAAQREKALQTTLEHHAALTTKAAALERDLDRLKAAWQTRVRVVSLQVLAVLLLFAVLGSWPVAQILGGEWFWYLVALQWGLAGAGYFLGRQLASRGRRG